jgi:hemerythrin-like metal-binding protein
MAFVNWSNEWKVGVRLFDSDHKRIFELINDLHESIVAGIDAARLNEALDVLDTHIAAHSKHEEDYFDNTGYPNASRHRGLHKAYSDAMANFRAEITHAATSAQKVELLLIHKGWHLLHLQEEDKELGKFLTSKGIH